MAAHLISAFTYIFNLVSFILVIDWSRDWFVPFQVFRGIFILFRGGGGGVWKYLRRIFWKWFWFSGLTAVSPAPFAVHLLKSDRGRSTVARLVCLLVVGDIVDTPPRCSLSRLPSLIFFLRPPLSAFSLFLSHPVPTPFPTHFPPSFLTLFPPFPSPSPLFYLLALM